MSVVDVILSRRSIRKYRMKSVPHKIVRRILEAGRHAPSASNMQPWHFIIVADQKIKEELSEGRWNTFIKESAFTIVGCAYVGNAYGRKWSTIDTTIALENMVIAAWSLGVGSCWIGDFKARDVKELLKIPPDWKIVSLVSFGYPDERPKKTSRKRIGEIVSYDRF